MDSEVKRAVLTREQFDEVVSTIEVYYYSDADVPADVPFETSVDEGSSSMPTKQMLELAGVLLSKDDRLALFEEYWPVLEQEFRESINTLQKSLPELGQGEEFSIDTERTLLMKILHLD